MCDLSVFSFQVLKPVIPQIGVAAAVRRDRKPGCQIQSWPAEAEN